MEQLIIFAIIAIVSSLFGKSKNNKQQQKQMPPFNKDEQPQSPVIMETEEVKPQRPTRPTIKTQSFEDFAREFLGDRKAEKPKVEARESRVKPVEEKVTEQMPSYMAPPLIPTEPSSRSTNRPSIGRLASGKKEVNVATTNKGFQLPNSKKAFMQAVVMAEVLGPPKAKRK
ncbi:hypothetical protein FOH38_01545 [Lysinibacillus fusiformis]|nr:hypothetical protein FOH38_01545 [Lysinibacillus fusiformis]